jgi:putative hemolysin
MEILIIAILILLNGVFSMSEIALISSRKFKLENEAKKGNSNARKAFELANSPNTFLSTVQIGITLIGILTGIFSGKALTDDLTLLFSNINVLEPYADSLAVVTLVIIITYVTIVFGELIPKRLGLHFPEKIATAVARPMSILSLITKPIIWLLAKTNDLFLGIFGIKEKQDGFITEEEIKQIIQESVEGGEIRQIEQDIVKRVFSLGDRKARELMTHRNDFVWISSEDSFADIKQKVDADPHSVYPVCNRSIEELIGFISLKQLFSLDANSEMSDVLDKTQKPLYVPENMAAYKVLEYFKSNRTHSAIVVDEYGSIQGLITMDDVMDELIGDVVEEDVNEYQLTQRNENSWLIDGQYPYFELLEYFNIIDEEEVNGFTTVGGLFIFQSNHIPKLGEKIQWHNYEMEIMDMDGHRIDKILLTKL